MRSPLLLLLAAAAPAVAGILEELGRNTDTSLTLDARSALVAAGRAPDVGPLASLEASARLSIPASSFNVVLAAGADRSLDGSPRLDRRSAGLAVEWFGESLHARLAARHDLNLGLNPASLSRLRSETALEAVLDGWRLGEDWRLGLGLHGVPRREERRAELALERSFVPPPDIPLSLHLRLEVGDLRALDADGDGQGRVEGWSYGGVRLSLEPRLFEPGMGSLYLTLGTQQTSDSSGDRDGWVELSFYRVF